MPHMYIHICTLLVQPQFPLGSHNVTYHHRCVFILLFFGVLKPPFLPPGMSSFPSLQLLEVAWVGLLNCRGPGLLTTSGRVDCFTD